MAKILSPVTTPAVEVADNVRDPHTRPSDVFRRNLRKLRKRRRYRQADLAEHLGVDRSVISRIENGHAEIGLDEALAICATLGVSPLALLSQDSPIEVAPGEIIDGAVFRQWLRGNAWVRPDNLDYIPAEVDIENWTRRVNSSIQQVIRCNQALLDALEPFIDPDSEAAASARKCLDAANAEIDGFARAVAERSSARAIAPQRIRRAA